MANHRLSVGQRWFLLVMEPGVLRCLPRGAETLAASFDPSERWILQRRRSRPLGWRFLDQ